MTTNTVTATTIDEWLQFCQETLMDEDNGQADIPTEGLFGAISGFMQIPEHNVNPSNSCSSNAQLSPKSILSKPIRRRSRLSKKTPITLLNANTSNFRALVQKFTGFPSKGTGSIFAHQKGPITLNFQKGTGHVVLQNHGNVIPAWSYHGSAVSESLAQSQQLQQQKQLVFQPQEATFLQENSSMNIIPSALTSYQTSRDISDHHRFIFGDDINLQKMKVSSFNGVDHVKDACYFL